MNTPLDYQDILPALQLGDLDPVCHTSIPIGTGRIQVDSRKVEPGDIFVTWTKYVDEARGKGASLIVGSLLNCDIQVSCGRAAWSWLYSAAYQHSHKKLTLLGITGTNGKTSTAWITSTLLRNAGHSVLTIGTLGAFFDENNRTPLFHTTPDPDVLYPLLQTACEQQAIVVMEVSSHSIAQKKLEPLSFTGCAFTSFSQDHLDFHKTMENYWDTKWNFVKKSKKIALYDTLIEKAKTEKIAGEISTYGYDAQSDVQISFCKNELQLQSSSQTLKGSIPWLGLFAEQNFAASWLLAQFCGVHLTSNLWKGSTIPGRMEKVHQNPDVFIDYAHTPDALEQTLKSFQGPDQGPLTVLFGCGGNRDQDKRSIMGQVATKFADHVILTSDNPRCEDPEKILQAIESGCSSPVTKITDRKAAIHHALAHAKPHDIIIIAGKGHETTQETNGSKTPFNDKEIVQSYFMKGKA